MDDLFDANAGAAGGDGGNSGVLNAAETVLDRPEPGGEGGGEGGGEKMIPIQRFNQVYSKMKDLETRMKTYSELGDIEEVRRIREEHAQWKKSIEDYRAKQAMTDDEKEAGVRKERILKQLFDVYPELKHIPDLMKKLATLETGVTTTVTEKIMDRASTELSEMLKTNKIDLGMQDEIEDYLAARMTEEESQRFMSGDMEIMKEKFNQSLEKGLLSKFRSSAKLPMPPARHQAGGTPPGTPLKAKTLDEATSAAWESFSNPE